MVVTHWPEANFSWLAELPSIYRESQTRRAMDEALKNFDLNDPVASDKAISNLLRSGPAGIEKAAVLSEIVRKRREQAISERASAHSEREIQGLTGGQASTGPTPSVPTGPLPSMVAQAEAAHPALTANPGLLGKMIQAESAGKPMVISPKGAIGYTQLMPKTAEELGVDPNDPAQNIAGGAKYLNDQIRRFGSVGLGLAAYNAGPERVQQWLEGKITNLPTETQRYVGNITGKSVQQWRSEGRSYTDQPDQRPIRVAQAGPMTAVPGATEDTRSPLQRAEADAEAMGAQYRQQSGRPNAETAKAMTMAQRRGLPKEAQDVWEKMAQAGHTQRLQIQKDEYEDFRKDRDDRYKNSDAAETALRTMETMEKIMNNPNFQSGASQDLISRFGSALVSVASYANNQFGMGINLDSLKGIKDTTQLQEQFRALSNQLVIARAGGSLGHQISNPDRDFIRDASLSLGNLPEANKIILEFNKVLSQRDKDIAAIVRKYERSGGKSKADVQELIERYRENSPLFVAGRDKNGNVIHTKLGKRINDQMEESQAAAAKRAGQPTVPERVKSAASGIPGLLQSGIDAIVGRVEGAAEQSKLARQGQPGGIAGAIQGGISSLADAAEAAAARSQAARAAQAPPPPPQGPVQAGMWGRGGGGPPRPTPEVIEALRSNPSLIPLFDAKYGPGAAQRYLAGG